MTAHLKDQFVAFAKFGMPRHHDGSHITLSQSDKWLKQARVVDGKNVTTTDTGILFRKMSRFEQKKVSEKNDEMATQKENNSRNYVWMSFREWYSYIKELSVEKEIEFRVVKEALATCGLPIGHNTTVHLEQ